MAAIQPKAVTGSKKPGNNDVIDFEEIGNAMKKHLPPYACPVFFRIMDSIPVTSTFKHKKTDLAKDGWKSGDVGVGSDDVYHYDFKEKKLFTKITPEIEKNINEGVRRL